MEFCKILAQNGYNLMMVDVWKPELERARQLLCQKYTSLRIDAFVQDLSFPEAAENLYRFAEENGLEVEILINNAGLNCFGKFNNTPWQREYQILQVQIHTLTQKRY